MHALLPLQKVQRKLTPKSLSLETKGLKRQLGVNKLCTWLKKKLPNEMKKTESKE